MRIHLLSATLAALSLVSSGAAGQDTALVSVSANTLLALPALIEPARIQPIGWSRVGDIRPILEMHRLPDTRYEQPTKLPLGHVGLEVSIIEPRGEFRNFVKASIGWGAQGILALDRRGAFSLGFDFRSVAYDGQEYQDTIRVSNMMRTFTIGSRYTIPMRYVHPYIGGAVGGAYFGTETNVKTWKWDDEEEDWKQVTELQSVKNARMTYTVVRSAGMQMDVYRDRRAARPYTVSLDLGVSDHSGGRTSYITAGRGPRFRSATDYRVYRIGVSLWSR
jgi:hypothetical protein